MKKQIKTLLKTKAETDPDQVSPGPGCRRVLLFQDSRAPSVHPTRPSSEQNLVLDSGFVSLQRRQAGGGPVLQWCDHPEPGLHRRPGDAAGRPVHGHRSPQGDKTQLVIFTVRPAELHQNISCERFNAVTRVNRSLMSAGTMSEDCSR